MIAPLDNFESWHKEKMSYEKISWEKDQIYLTEYDDQGYSYAKGLYFKKLIAPFGQGSLVVTVAIYPQTQLDLMDSYVQ